MALMNNADRIIHLEESVCGLEHRLSVAYSDRATLQSRIKSLEDENWSLALRLKASNERENKYLASFFGRQ